MLVHSAMMLALSQGLMSPLTPVNTRSLSHITMQSYTEYLADRQRSAASVPVVTGGYAEYMAKRNPAAIAPVVENPVPTPEIPVHVAAAGGYAEFMAKRDGEASVQQQNDGGFAEYMAKRNAAVTVPAAASAPVVAVGGFAEYMAKRNAAVTVPAAASAPVVAVGGFAEYMAKRNAAVTAPVVESPVPTPVAPTPVGGFAEYMAKRNAAVTAKAAETFKPKYDPWRDPEKAVVSFIVDGVPKKYRIQM